VNGGAFQHSTAVTALLPVLSRVFRPWPTAAPGSVPTTAVYPDVAEPSAKPLFVSTAGSYPAAVEELLVDVLTAGLAYLLKLLVVRLIRQIIPAR